MTQDNRFASAVAPRAEVRRPSSAADKAVSHPMRTATALGGFLQNFRAREGGNITVFSVFMFVGIAAFTGIGVDLMLNETKRTQLQGWLDNGVLAATNLNQARDAETVVRDYMAAGGLEGRLTEVEVARTANRSEVEASARDVTEPLFAQILGVEALTAPAHAAAENTSGDIEISMILDISGSMGWDHMGEIKIDTLKDAATTFVDLVLNPDRNGVTSISLVSYNSYTNIGPNVAQHVLNDPGNCYFFRDGDFYDTTLTFEERARRPEGRGGGGTCAWSNTAEIVVHNTDRTTLHNEINAMTAGGWTAIEVGMKWGLTLLDPSSNWLVRDMIAEGDVAGAMTNRPVAFSDPDTLKVAVLMTDGENTVHGNQDAQLARICQAARDDGVVIYTVAFAAPAGGVAAMQSCASSDGHFFDVQGTDLTEAFAAIATSISKLRLTQ